MKKTICNKEYDTDTATLIEKYTEGELGDPAGFEETIYCTPDGHYFVYVNGGAESKHPKEGIRRISKSAFLSLKRN